MMKVEVFAPAKINLALHVTGQRADGYHLIDSLVGFAAFGDMLRLSPAEMPEIIVSGSEAAGVPSDASNLALRASARAAAGVPVSIALEKRLPAASGIGGGSADAAAVLRGLCALGARLSDTDLAAAALELGADVPMCLDPVPSRVRGIGEDLTPVKLPGLPCVLVNPRVAVSTPGVFARLQTRANPGLTPSPVGWYGVTEFVHWLGRQRNDLQPPACALAPVIGEVLEAISLAPDCLLSRMSGSGATCFGLYETEASAKAAAERLLADHPEWWIQATVLDDQSSRSAPRPV
ncbi:MAG: 4-(cytidine 5'-diphospho)-2-C-methyl-D-erythritol kinase [Pseudomonadota bacterium]